MLKFDLKGGEHASIYHEYCLKNIIEKFIQNNRVHSIIVNVPLIDYSIKELTEPTNKKGILCCTEGARELRSLFMGQTRCFRPYVYTS